MLFCQDNSTPETRHLEQVVAGAIKIQQCCKPHKPGVQQRTFLCYLHAGTVFFQIVSRKAHCWSVLHNVFIDAALIHWGNTSISDRDLKNWVALVWKPSSSRRVVWMKWNSWERLFIWNADTALSSVNTFFRDRRYLPSRAEPRNHNAWSPLSLRWRRTREGRCSRGQ